MDGNKDGVGPSTPDPDDLVKRFCIQMPTRSAGLDSQWAMAWAASQPRRELPERQRSLPLKRAALSGSESVCLELVRYGCNPLEQLLTSFRLVYKS